MSDEWAHLPEYLTAHLQLSLAALLLGLLVSVPAGIWVTRNASREAPVLGVASILQTIPSLALLAFMVPALSALGALTLSMFGFEIRSIGFLPALAALTLYSLLPILRNTVTGIAGVDPALVEAARGVGMTPRQQLWRVELPLAMPVIVAGVRTATVWVVGTATLATPVGATSLGNYIFSGLQTRNFVAVMIGSGAAAVLALSLDGLIRWLEIGTRTRSRPKILAASVTLLALCLYSAGSWWWASAGGAGRDIAIGSKTFTEQYIVAAILSQQIEARTGLGTTNVPSLGSTVAFDALRNDEIDAYVDYSGTIWATIMKRTSLPNDRSQVVAEVARFLEEEHGITLVASLGFENTYALAMRASQADELGVETLSDLARFAPRLEIGGDYEFFERPEWDALVERYGFAFRAERSMDSALMYQAAASEQVDVISAFSTDGRIAGFGLRLLVDDLGVVPPYDAIVLASPGVARDEPAVLTAIAELADRIDEKTMQRLNYAVDAGGESPASVAREFLAGSAGAP